ncbi:MAG: TnsA endonuclease C-terminal domain-containing protein, partial [Caulobacteraceae bacterium]
MDFVHFKYTLAMLLPLPKIKHERRLTYKIILRVLTMGSIIENEINREFASNIEWVHDAYKLEPIGNLDIPALIKHTAILKERLLNNSLITLQNVLHELDSEFNYESGV